MENYRSNLAAQFGSNLLAGQTVMVTRPGGEDDALTRLLRELGAEVLVQPVIRISDPPDWQAVDSVLDRLDQFDWIVFSSANGVEYFLGRLRAIGGDFGQLHRAKLAAIGPATSDALLRHRLLADVIPPEFRAESLAESLVGEAPGKQFLLVRASRGREILAEQLRSAGAMVEQVVAYTSSDIDQPDPDIAAKLAAGKIDWITVTSSSIARALAALFGEKLRQSKLASISPVTSATLRELGYKPAAEAEQYTMPGLVDTIRHAVA
ncbi:MAG: uroporphyrinogen-III synthase [Thermoguttaceae bacterium]|jgi:uroporphyrinogen III methyltransferase/synthase